MIYLLLYLGIHSFFLLYIFKRTQEVNGKAAIKRPPVFPHLLLFSKSRYAEVVEVLKKFILIEHQAKRNTGIVLPLSQNTCTIS